MIAVGRGSRLAQFATSSESSSDKQPRLLAKHPGQLDRYAEEQSVVSSHGPIEPQVAQEEPQVEEEFPAPEVGTAGKFISIKNTAKIVTTLKKISLSFFRQTDQSLDQLCSS